MDKKRLACLESGQIVPYEVCHKEEDHASQQVYTRQKFISVGLGKIFEVDGIRQSWDKLYNFYIPDPDYAV